MVQPAAGLRPKNDDRSENLSEWVQLHMRELAIAVIVVAVVVAGVLTYRRVSAGTARKAEQAFFAAEQLRQVEGDSAATAALQRVSGQYRGTAGGTQAAILLAQLRYDAGQYAEGLADLEELRGSGVKGEFRASIEALIAAGYEGEARYAEAATAYRKAADAARFPADRDSYRADAARVLAAGGQTAEAAAIWQEIADDPTSPLSEEARVRLGELTVKPAGQG